MSSELIDKARRRYLAANPLRLSTLQSINGSASMTFPNIDDIQIIGCKLGMEYLAICHDEEAVNEWIASSIGIVKEPELVGLLFANVFRGFNVVISGIIEQTPGLREQIYKLALQAWEKDFADFGGEA